MKIDNAREAWNYFRQLRTAKDTLDNIEKQLAKLEKKCPGLPVANISESFHVNCIWFNLAVGDTQDAVDKFYEEW